MNLFRMTPLALALALATVMPAYAATPPDAGQILQENAPTIEAPRPTPEIGIEAPSTSTTAPGGVEVTVQSLSFSGNAHISEDVLRSAIGEVAGKTYDLAGLRGLANHVTDYYHAQGYPFARAYLPPQPLKDWQLHIEVVEGKYGAVTTTGDDEKLSASAQKFLSRLVPGEVIESKSLERAALILDDLPGIKSVPLVRPGQQVGTGDLAVRVERDKRFGGDVGVDNYGNRYTGRNRVRASVYANSPFMIGDQITVSGLYTQENMWYGALGYSLPIGSNGLRGQVSYAHTYYELGKQFASLNASGTANVTSVGVSYPILRSQRANLHASGTFQYKTLNDEQGATATSNGKSSSALPLALNFDLRDSIGSGGITYGSVSWTHGNLNLDNSLKLVDSTTAKTNGSYNKYNLDLARLQALPKNFTLYARVSAQLASENLDSSEGFGLGGQSGVRAYPSGEGFGDEGWLTQVEMRYNYKAVTPYAFYDAGHVKVNHSTWAAGSNDRSIAGVGLGLRANYNNWSADVTVAWRTHGGKPESDTQDQNPLFWAGAGYKF